MSLRVAFVRPRLGIGGAERLVIDAARILTARGNEVAVFAPDLESTPQFDELATPPFLRSRRGGFLPESLLGRLRAPCAIARSAAAGLLARSFEPEVVFADVTSHVVPFLRRVIRAPVVFYCHFPDALLTREGARSRSWYQHYRGPLDLLEGRGLGAAQTLLANSAYTVTRIRDVFPDQASRVRVLAPAIDCSQFPVEPINGTGEIGAIVVSRFDPRKNLALAIESFAVARSRVAEEIASRMVLHLAGRYDERLSESRDTLAMLTTRAKELGVNEAVRFHPSPSDAVVRRLISNARLAVYPSRGEHFGYGPLEAMASGRPVVAVNDGGPAETIIDGVTGFLRSAEAASFARAIVDCVEDPEKASQMGQAGREHVTRNFSLDGFGAALERILDEARQDGRPAKGR